jgi:pentatricopeptide repeat protein
MARTEAHLQPAAATEPPELVDALARLRGLVEQSRVEEARTYVKEMEQRWPASERVQYWARVLAPPVARVVPGGPHPPLDAEYAWIREHGREYPGCWIAVKGNRLVAADRDPGVVIDAVRQSPESKDALLHYSPEATK